MLETIAYDVHDLAVYPLTPGDSATSPSWGAPVDVPGISEVGLDPEIVEAILKGDGRVIDRRAKLETVGLSFTYGKLALAVLSAIDGGTVTTGTGTGDPDTTSRYVRKAGDAFPRFGIAALISEVDVEAGQAKLYVHDSRQGGATLFSGSTDEYGRPSFDVVGIPSEDSQQANADGVLWSLDLEEVGTDLPADGAEFAATRLALT